MSSRWPMMADLDTHCANLQACRGQGVARCDDGEFICRLCGKLVSQSSARVPAAERRPVRRRRRSATAIPAGGRSGRSGQLRRLSSASIPEVRPLPASNRIVQTQQCTTCDGRIGQGRWDEGHRQCVRCAPLEVAAIGVHKSIPSILPVSEATARNTEQGRRRS
jgi:hypothetical protein